MDWEVTAVALTGAFGIVGVLGTLMTSRQAVRLAELNAAGPILLDAINRRNAVYAELLAFVQDTHVFSLPEDELGFQRLESVREKLRFESTRGVALQLLMYGSPTMNDAFGLWASLTRDIAEFHHDGDEERLASYGGLDDAVIAQIEVHALIIHGVGFEVRGEGLIPSSGTDDRDRLRVVAGALSVVIPRMAPSIARARLVRQRARVATWRRRRRADTDGA